MAWIQVLPGRANAIVVSPGANAALTPGTVETLLESVREGDFVLCQLEVPLEAVETALRLARDRNATGILDPAPARPLSASFLGLAGIVTPNETEVARLFDTKHLSPSLATVALPLAGTPRAVVKNGKDGTWICDGAGSRHIPAFEVEAVDSTAAGDTFNGALAVTLSEGLRFDEAARFAAAAAAVCVTRAGAQASCPARQEVDALLAGE